MTYIDLGAGDVDRCQVRHRFVPIRSFAARVEGVLLRVDTMYAPRGHGFSSDPTEGAHRGTWLLFHFKETTSLG